MIKRTFKSIYGVMVKISNAKNAYLKHNNGYVAWY